MKKFVIILTAVLLAFCITSCGNSEEELYMVRENAYSSGYEEGFEEGYSEGRNDAYDDSYSGNSIEDMDVDDIVAYLEEVTGEQILIGEDAHGFAVYAFQLGYKNHKYGVWDEMTQELINGYEFSDRDAAWYLNMLY